MKLRRLTPDGTAQFAAYLNGLRAEPSLAPPYQLLNDPASSELISADVELDDNPFPAHFEAAAYLNEKLAAAGIPDLHLDRDVGLWSWLALFTLNSCARQRRAERAKSVKSPDIFRRSKPSAQLQRFGSSPNSGEGGSDFEVEVGVVSEAVGHSLDDFDLVVDSFQNARVQWEAAVAEDAGQIPQGTCGWR